jgi:hypothetical protein
MSVTVRILSVHTHCRKPGGKDVFMRAERAAHERAGCEVEHRIEDLSDIGWIPDVLDEDQAGSISPLNRSDAVARILVLANDHAVAALRAHVRQRYSDTVRSPAVVAIGAVYAGEQSSVPS